MTDEITERDVAQLIAMLESATGKPSPPMALAIWCVGMRGLTRDAMFRAAEQFICVNTFPVFPTPGTIRRNAIDLIYGVPISPEEAFRSLTISIGFGNFGEEKARAFLGDEIWSVIEGLGGWSEILCQFRGQTSTLFAQFRDGWLRLVEKQRTANLLPPEILPRMLPAPNDDQGPEPIFSRIQSVRVKRSLEVTVSSEPNANLTSNHF